jgi:hypothetical protein
MQTLKYFTLSLVLFSSFPTFAKGIQQSLLPRSIVQILSSSFSATEVKEHDPFDGFNFFGETQIRYQGYSLRLMYHYDGSNLAYGIPAQGASFKNVPSKTYNPFPTELCLDLHLDLEQFESQISYITTDYDCGLPQEKKGAFLMHLSDALFQSHKIVSSTLYDASKVKCSKNEGKTEGELGFLHLFEKGQSWYESLGYQTSAFSPEEFQEIKSQLSNTPLREIEEALIHTSSKAKETFLAQCSENIVIFRKLLREFEKIKSPRPHSTIGSFMPWVWNHHCDQYSKVARVLFLNSEMDDDTLDLCGVDKASIISEFQWAQDYDLIQESFQNMEKYFPIQKE